MYIMNTDKVIKQIIIFRDSSQAELAEFMGYKSQSNINGLLNRGNMGVDKLVRMVEALDCELVVRDKKGTKQEWIITF